jgi:hypothetical protein
VTREVVGMLCNFRAHDGITVNERDGLGISNEDSFTITAESAEAEILLMEVPMKL